VWIYHPEAVIYTYLQPRKFILAFRRCLWNYNHAIQYTQVLVLSVRIESWWLYEHISLTYATKGSNGWDTAQTTPSQDMQKTAHWHK
jgi:hypothetical protein